MRTIIENTWFPASTMIQIGEGSDQLEFRRCSFEGGQILIEQEVHRTIFRECVFRGTTFAGQCLSDRIAIACRQAPADTEESWVPGHPSRRRPGR